MNYRTVVNAVRAIVEANPDNRPDCNYFNPDESACCIVGNLFEEELRAAGISYDTNENSVSIQTLLDGKSGYRPVEVDLTPKALFFLGAIQRSQDASNSWRSAFAWAIGVSQSLGEYKYEYATPPLAAPVLP